MTPPTLGQGRVPTGKLCLGGRDFGSRLDRAASHRLLDRAEELGIDFIDLADIYPVPPHPDTWGRSEEIVGEWLATRRDRCVVATKVGARVGPGAADHGAGRRHILRACEASLRRLRTDHIDVYYIHHPDPATPIEETLAAMAELVTAGKVRNVGLSNFDAPLVRAAAAAAPLSLRPALAWVQSRYNLLHRAVETDLLSLCEQVGVALVPWNPLATGMLTGRYRRGAAPEPGSRFADGQYGARYRSYYWSERAFDLVDLLRQRAVVEGCSPAQLALAWVLRRRAVSAAVTGASTLGQLEESAEAPGLEVSSETTIMLDQASAWSLTGA